MSKLMRHMPGRRVSRHSKAKTFPATVALPIFRSRSRMGPGRVLMGLPIKILEALTAPPFFSPSAGAAAWDGAAAEAEGLPTGSLHVTSTSTFRKPYTPISSRFSSARASSPSSARVVRRSPMDMSD